MLSVYSLNAAKGLSFSETEDFASVELSVLTDKCAELLARPLACVFPALGRCAFCACAGRGFNLAHAHIRQVEQLAWRNDEIVTPASIALPSLTVVYAK